MDKRIDQIEDVLLRKQPTLQIMLENIHNSQNLSAIMRTCDGVGVLQLYYSTEDDKALRIHRTITQGTHRWVEKERIDHDKRIDFLRQKQKDGFQIVVTHLDGYAVSFRKVDYTKPTVIVMGNEKEGVSTEVISIADKTVIIPMMGMVQSLNISVAAALILYEAQGQLEETGKYKSPQLSSQMRKVIKEAWLYRDVIARRSKGKLPLKVLNWSLLDPLKGS